jgi:2-dehydro-3-deoxyphosphooctonate aldolase (KDO 8-P synthase)
MDNQQTPLSLQGRSFGRGSLFAICGPCVIEDSESPLFIAERLAQISQRLDLPLVFKASYDKANRTSVQSFRGPGLEEGLKLLARVKEKSGLPVLSDVHQPGQVPQAAEVLDVLQIPAFLCRQTDLLLAAGKSGRPVNVKKGQFLAPSGIPQVVEKLKSADCKHIWLTERGAAFGYNNLVVDMRSIPIMAESGCPVVMDATHSVQLPGGLGHASGGERRFVSTLAKAAVAAGADGVFMEVHPHPDQALCDGPNSLPLDSLEGLLRQLKAIHSLLRGES